MWTVLAFAGLLASFLVAYKYIWANRKDAYPPTLQQEKKILGEDESEENPSVRARQPWDYFLVLDVEATCVPGADFSWPNEIIVCLSASPSVNLLIFSAGMACRSFIMGRSGRSRWESLPAEGCR